MQAHTRTGTRRASSHMYAHTGIQAHVCTHPRRASSHVHTHTLGMQAHIPVHTHPGMQAHTCMYTPGVQVHRCTHQVCTHALSQASQSGFPGTEISPPSDRKSGMSSSGWPCWNFRHYVNFHSQHNGFLVIIIPCDSCFCMIQTSVLCPGAELHSAWHRQPSVEFSRSNTLLPLTPLIGHNPHKMLF